MASYITHGGRSEQGVDDGMNQRISVAVPQGTFFEWDRDAAEYERTALDKGVNVVAYAGPGRHEDAPGVRAVRCLRKLSASIRSSGVVTFMFS